MAIPTDVPYLQIIWKIIAERRQAVAQRLQRQTTAMESVARVVNKGLHELISGGREERKRLV
jgi:hypothetical protein